MQTTPRRVSVRAKVAEEMYKVRLEGRLTLYGINPLLSTCDLVFNRDAVEHCKTQTRPLSPRREAWSIERTARFSKPLCRFRSA